MESEKIVRPPYHNRSLVIINITVILALITIFILTISISLFQLRSPEVVPNEANSKEFSAERAFRYLENIAVNPRPPGSEEHARVKEYLMNTLTQFGLTPEVQKVDGPFSGWGSVSIETIENIVARIPGEDSTGAIMIAAHYDTVEGSPGAADDGSGVAAILETVRILLEKPALKNDIIILITDGEEAGLLGAQEFVRGHPWAQDVIIVLNFEARGNKGPSVLFETNEGNNRMISEFIKAAPNPIAHSFFYDLYKTLPNETDLSVFKAAGMYGLNFGFFDGLDHYHSINDTIENLSLNSLQHHGDYMLHLVQNYGELNLVSKDDGNRIYFNIIGNKMVSYSEALVFPMVIFAILAFVFTFLYGLKLKKLTIVGTMFGFAIFLLTIGFAYLFGQQLKTFVLFLLTDRIWLQKLIEQRMNTVFLVFIILFFVMLSVLYRLVNKKINTFNLLMGAYFVWLILSVLTGIYLKGSSYIFTWPLLLGLFGMNLLMMTQHVRSLNGYIINLGFAIPAILFISPIIYLIYMIVSLEEIAVLMALVSLPCAFIIPIVSTLSMNSPIFVQKHTKRNIKEEHQLNQK